MGLREVLDNSPTIVFGTVAVVAFGAGWTASQSILSASGRTTIAVERMKQLESHEAERDRLLTQNREQQSRIAGLMADVSQLKSATQNTTADELRSAKIRATRLEGDLATAESRAQELTRLAETRQRENERLERQIALLQQARSRANAPPPQTATDQQSHARPGEPAPSTVPSSMAGPVKVPIGQVVRLSSQLTIALSATSRDGDGRRAAKFYINGTETTERAFPGQRVPLPPGTPPGCYLQVLEVEYLPKTFATVEYVCPK